MAKRICKVCSMICSKICKKPELDEKKPKKETIADRHSSYVKHILIPLFGFHGYHQTVSEETGDAFFLGRKPILDRLTHWLADSNCRHGAYLITGFRGMGKSSFVGQALFRLMDREKRCANRLWVIATYFLSILVVSAYLLHDYKCLSYNWYMGGLLILIGMVPAIFWRVLGCRKDASFIVIKINVGNEVLGNREMLHLIVKNAYDKFKEYAWSYNRNPEWYWGRWWAKGVTAFWLFALVRTFVELKWGYAGETNVLLWGIRMLVVVNSWIGLVLTFPLAFFLWKRVSRWVGLVDAIPFQTSQSLLHRLYRLHERSIAAVTEEKTFSNQSVAFNLFRRRQYHAPSVHEMEQELISIFADMDKLWLITPPRFVIVLDELDKVDPPVTDGEKEILPEFNPSVGGFDAKGGPYGRQKELLRTLANMKYFMSTARAKFVFIAGRELYEAYLKDVSDREFSVSSIFNGVINVNSFLKPIDSKSDITSLTERFVCMHLMKEGGEEEMTLKHYFAERKEKIKDHADRDKLERRLARNVNLLYQFVLYLVHVSNGSPKKISMYFEKYIRSREYLKNRKFPLEEKPEECGCYLSFGAKDIQKIGFVHYIVYPVTQVMINKSKVYEDKLLVSTSFMINHIYKYHNTGFSWRNLEHIPELLEINKTPELRDFIGTIVSFLRKTHLTRILSGLYQFKFPMKISEEISFMSKQAEDLSALFNFSQDESRSIRKHYINLLEYYSRDINRIEQRELYIMASIHHILGDLYQEDEDYSQAIFEYQTGLQLLSRQLDEPDYDKDAHWVSSMLFLVRNMLKLGLTYEKRKTLDSAYLAYSELVQRMVDFRYLKEETFGLSYRIQDDTGRADREALLFFDSEKEGGKAMFPGFGELGQKDGFAFQCDHLKTEFARLLTPLKNSVISRMSFFDDVRMAYLPILAKLSVLEKMNMEGITQNNLDVAEAEFFFLHLATDDSEKVMAVPDFYNKFGDIMYYKNGLVNNRPANLFQSLYFWGYDLGWLKDAICKPFLESRDCASEKGEAYHFYRKIVEKWFDEQADEQQKNISTTEGLRYYLKKETELRLGSRCCRNVDWDEIIDHSFELYVPLEKVMECVRHREKFQEMGMRTPCYACKFYNRSMNVELERMMGWSWTEEKRKEKKAMIVAELLLTSEAEIRNMRDAQHNVIADTLKGLGIVMLSCADDTEHIRQEFWDYFFYVLRSYYDKEPLFKPSFTPGKLEKAILLLWEASVFYSMAGDGHTTYALNKHLLEVLDAYLKIHSGQKERRILRQVLENIKKYVVDRGIMALYAHYDHINLAELQKVKNMYGRDMYEDMDLNTLSVSPDIEELLYGYYRLQMAVQKEEEHDNPKQWLYAREIMGPYKHLCTLTQDVQNLKMKAQMNEWALGALLDWDYMKDGCEDGHKEGADFYEKFYENLSVFLEKGKTGEKVVKINGLCKQGVMEWKKGERMELLNFLVSDSLFCLTKILGMISPLGNTTLYTNVFMGETNLSLWKWTIAFELLCLVYRASEQTEGGGGNTFQTLVQKYEVNKEKVEGAFKAAADTIRQIRKESEFVNYSQLLKENVLELVGVDMFHRLTKTDRVEAVIHYFERAMDMHSEGKAYKEMIRALYFLDDDLNNDTCQLSFSIERFLINAGWVKRHLETYKRQVAFSSVYDSEHYIKK